jgi:hypothetical protein
MTLGITNRGGSASFNLTLVGANIVTAEKSIFWPNACIVCGTNENLDNSYDYDFKERMSDRLGDTLHRVNLMIPASFRICTKCMSLIDDYIDSAGPEYKRAEKVSGALFALGIITGIVTVVLFFFWSYLSSMTGLTIWQALLVPVFGISMIVFCLSCIAAPSDKIRLQLKTKPFIVFMEFKPVLEIGLSLDESRTSRTFHQIEDYIGPSVILNFAFTNPTYLELFENMNLRRYIFPPGSFFEKLVQLGFEVGPLLDSRHVATELKTDIDPEVRKHILSQVLELGIRCTNCGHESDPRIAGKAKFHRCPNCGHLQRADSE